MIKKAVSIIICLCICLTSFAFLFSCNEKSDGENNNVCSTDGSGNNGGDPEKKELTKEDFAEAIGSASARCKELVASQVEADNDSVLGSADLAASDGDLQNVDRYDIVFAAAWYMNFLKNVCHREGYTPSEEFADCYIYDAESDASYKCRFNMSYDDQTNNVTSVVYAYDIKNSAPWVLAFDVNYDFENKRLISFELKCYLGEKDFDQDEVYVFMYDGDRLGQTVIGSATHAVAVTYVRSMFDRHVTQNWSEDLPDFSEEYVSGRDELLS